MDNNIGQAEGIDIISVMSIRQHRGWLQQQLSNDRAGGSLVPLYEQNVLAAIKALENVERVLMGESLPVPDPCLKEWPTASLVNALDGREGVRKKEIMPHDHYTGVDGATRTGPAILFEIID